MNSTPRDLICNQVLANCRGTRIGRGVLRFPILTPCADIALQTARPAPFNLGHRPRPLSSVAPLLLAAITATCVAVPQVSASRILSWRPEDTESYFRLQLIAATCDRRPVFGFSPTELGLQRRFRRRLVQPGGATNRRVSVLCLCSPASESHPEPPAEVGWGSAR